MPNNDHRLRALLSELKTPPVSEPFVARLNAIALQPQSNGWFSHLRLVDELSFGLRHDLRLQLTAAGALALVLSLGVWQGLTPNAAPRGIAVSESEAFAQLMEVDPVLAGGL